MKIKVELSIGFPTAIYKDILEVDDDATDEELDEITMEWANNYICAYWEKV